MNYRIMTDLFLKQGLLVGSVFVGLTFASGLRAADPATDGGSANMNMVEDANAPDLSLVFSDDFVSDPNTNGQWTVHRYVNNPDTEAVWDPTFQVWHLTRPFEYLGVAVFANYELTATEWKAEFRYRVGKLGGVFGGGDGIVFMFYKDKDRYGQPAYGTGMGFELSNFQPVSGYGLQFDDYDSGQSCDPTPNDHIGIVEDDICNSLVFREDARAGDNLWHTIEFKFTNGKISVSIDGITSLRYELKNPDYTFSGIGFGAGTGAAVADQQIDNFRLWVRQSAAR